MKIRVQVGHLVPETSYAIDVLLGEIGGIPYDISVADTPAGETRLVLENGRRLVLADTFFSKHREPSSYLRQENIPEGVCWQPRAENPFLAEENLPIWYGDGRLRVEEAEIRWDIDVFATVFYCLSRWEEQVIPERDRHGRFRAADSLAGRAGFLGRPVVNEYAETVWRMLAHLGVGQARRPRRFRAMVTHDIDYPLLWGGTWSLARKLGGSLLRRRDIGEAGYYVRQYGQFRRGKEPDPYDNLDWLMDRSEAVGLRSHFFFMAQGTHPEDRRTQVPEEHLRNRMAEIAARGHHIGFHPSYRTGEDPMLFRAEKAWLERLAGKEIRIGRQHFLRFSVPETWRRWAEAGMEWDSSLGYAEVPGFRAGICDPFPVFDILARRPLPLREYPLLAMDTTWFAYKRSTPAQAAAELSELVGTVRRYAGTFVLLWHNTSFIPPWAAYRPVYEALLEALGAGDGG